MRHKVWKRVGSARVQVEMRIEGWIKVVLSAFTSTVPSGAVPSEIRGFAPSSRRFSTFSTLSNLVTLSTLKSCLTLERHIHFVVVSVYFQPDQKPSGESRIRFHL